jgi:hypothetical protein
MPAAVSTAKLVRIKASLPNEVLVVNFATAAAVHKL